MRLSSVTGPRGQRNLSPPRSAALTYLLTVEVVPMHGHARRVMPARGHASTAPCLGHHETVSHARHPSPSASEPDAVEFVNIGSHDLAKRLRRLFRDGKPNKLNPAQFAKMTCWNSGRATWTSRTNWMRSSIRPSKRARPRHDRVLARHAAPVLAGLTLPRVGKLPRSR